MLNSDSKFLSNTQKLRSRDQITIYGATPGSTLFLTSSVQVQLDITSHVSNPNPSVASLTDPIGSMLLNEAARNSSGSRASG